MEAKRPDVLYYKGILGLLGFLGCPPFNVLAWYYGRRDMRAPGFAEMPWVYRKRVRLTYKFGVVGTVLMILFFLLSLMMITIKAFFPR